MRGETVTLKGKVGTAVLEASQGGDPDYLAAPIVRTSFAVKAL